MIVPDCSEVYSFEFCLLRILFHDSVRLIITCLCAAKCNDYLDCTNDLEGRKKVCSITRRGSFGKRVGDILATTTHLRADVRVRIHSYWIRIIVNAC